MLTCIFICLQFRIFPGEQRGGSEVRKQSKGHWPWAGMAGLASLPCAFCLPSHGTLCLWLQSGQPRLDLEAAAAQTPRTVEVQAGRMSRKELSEDHGGTLRNVQIQVGSHARTRPSRTWMSADGMKMTSCGLHSSQGTGSDGVSRPFSLSLSICPQMHSLPFLCSAHVTGKMSLGPSCFSGSVFPADFSQ